MKKTLHSARIVPMSLKRKDVSREPTCVELGVKDLQFTIVTRNLHFVVEG